MIPSFSKNKETSDFVKSTKGIYVDNTSKNKLNTSKYFLPLSFGISFEIGSVMIPQYSKGMLMTYNSGDAALIAIDPRGNLYTAFRNGTTWQYGKKWDI